MSLLMEALRKAEEAKRLAAQQTKEQPAEGSEDQVSASQPADAVALEALMDNETDLVDYTGSSSETLALGDSGADREAGKTLDDIPFDFDIDESFGLEEPMAPVEDPVAEAPRSDLAFTPAVADEAHAPGPDTLSLVEEEPDDEEEVIEWETSAPEPVVSSELSLDEIETSSDVGEPEDDDGYLKAADLAKLTVAPVVMAPSDESPLEHADILARDELPAAAEPEPSATRESTAKSGASEELADIEAVRDSGRDLRREKGLEEKRRRESASAVFRAKTARGTGGSRKKIMAIAAGVALIPLAGGVYLVLQLLGVFPTGTQYSIPPGFNAGVAPFEVSEEGLAEPDAVLPDLSPADAVVAELAPSAQGIPSDEMSLEDENALEITHSTSPEPRQSQPDTAPAAGAIIESAPASTPALRSVAVENPSTQPAQVAESVPMPGPEAPTVETAGSNEVAAGPINITRTDTPGRINPQLLQAYQSYRSNDFVAARMSYQQVLREDPRNRDAILGLSAVSMQLGDAASAREGYVKLLELDPRDVHARMGLLETVPASDPVQLESELRALFAAHPEVAQLAFALGNHFASMGRWSDAQQSYYDALLAAKSAGDSAMSPDYAFNLAVSLERLNQPRSAYTYYREALDQASLVSPGFDIRVLRDRLDAIERVLP